MKTRTGAEPRTAAAHAARRRKTAKALERVRQTIARLQREKAQVSVVAVARRADVSRTFLYGNAEAREMVAAAITSARARQNQVLAEQDDAREATWRERALNAEQALKAAYAEVLAQRTRMVNSSATWKPNGPKKPSNASPPRTPRSSSASVSSPPTTEPSTNVSRPPAPTCASKTAASPTSKPRSPIRRREPGNDAVVARAGLIGTTRPRSPAACGGRASLTTSSI